VLPQNSMHPVLILGVDGRRHTESIGQSVRQGFSVIETGVQLAMGETGTLSPLLTGQARTSIEVDGTRMMRREPGLCDPITWFRVWKRRQKQFSSREPADHGRLSYLTAARSHVGLRRGFWVLTLPFCQLGAGGVSRSLSTACGQRTLPWECHYRTRTWIGSQPGRSVLP
jgi:hypothetical protein